MLFDPLIAFLAILSAVVAQGFRLNLAVVLINDDPVGKPGEIRHISNERVNITHIEVPHDLDIEGAWTYFPLIKRLSVLQTDWTLIVNQKTQLNFGVLPNILEAYDVNQPLFIGYSLKDETSTIVHHYSAADLAYPLRSSGFLLSKELITRLSKALCTNPPDHSFSIDAAYEFAAYLNEELDVQLTHDDSFCLSEADGCFTHVRKTGDNFFDAFHPDELFVAVKTYSGFHKSRLPIVKKTWGRDSSRIVYFSNREDPSIPTVSTSLPNTERGHCSKTAFILNYVHKVMADDPRLKWLLVADDDTIISLPRLRRLLSSYVAMKPVILGERYGYGWNEKSGYDYITGGGGMVFNRLAVEKLISGGCTQCPTDDTPDDMFLGACAKWQRIHIVHCDGFHQARPMDYPRDILKSQFVISFHKHWNLDPADIYEKWFGGKSECRDEL